MGFKQTGYSGVDAEVEASVRAVRAINVGRGTPFCVSTVTGTIGAALAANSPVFAMRLDPGAAVRAFIERIRLEYTTIVAFTTPVTAARRLALFRGSGAAAAGGTAITTAQKKHTNFGGTSEMDTANGGDIRVSTTAALTVVGLTFETDPLRQMTLTHVGAAGGFREVIWEFHATENSPVVLEPGQVLAIRNPVAMDAAGTWQLGVNVDWHEAAAFS